MISKQKLAAAFISIVILIVASPAFCLDSLIVNINQACVINNPRNNDDARILFRFDIPNSLDSSCYVMVAELRFGVNIQQAFDRPIVMHANPITRDWLPENANWHAPWLQAGGDYLDSVRAVGYIRPNYGSALKIDLAHLIKDNIRGYRQNYGFIIRQQGDLRRAFALNRINLPGGGSAFAQLAIYYVDTDRGE